ncbi:MAG TPA: hypothetical protein VGR28_11450 [Candidatus Thermoplasmatota archaeon]|jgi:hypothetical protein|nr:hypothetical protein [Candidatus Thermoplasmatota archaeon]
MGLFDKLRGGTPEQRAARAALEQAQHRRRAHPPVRPNGRVVTQARLRHYEHLERKILVEVGRFPWGTDEARLRLQEKGFDPKAVEAYLASEAVRALLG